MTEAELRKALDDSERDVRHLTRLLEVAQTRLRGLRALASNRGLLEDGTGEARDDR